MVEQKHERYVNPYTDYGFKKWFCSELMGSPCYGKNGDRL